MVALVVAENKNLFQVESVGDSTAIYFLPNNIFKTPVFYSDDFSKYIPFSMMKEICDKLNGEFASEIQKHFLLNYQNGFEVGCTYTLNKLEDE